MAQNRIARIIMPAHLGQATVEVRYRGRTLHTEPVVDDVRGHVVDARVRAAAEDCEQWALAHGFTGVIQL